MGSKTTIDGYISGVFLSTNIEIPKLIKKCKKTICRHLLHVKNCGIYKNKCVQICLHAAFMHFLHLWKMFPPFLF